MGLDQYLSKKIYVKNWEHMADSEKTFFTVTGKLAKAIDVTKIKYIEEEVMYWRKANQIHGWFVENVQNGNDDCGEYYVDREKLEELKDAIDLVLTAKTKEVACGVLPPTSGFFFGGYEVDEWYWKELETTSVALASALKDDDGEYYYHASW